MKTSIQLLSLYTFWSSPAAQSHLTSAFAPSSKIRRVTRVRGIASLRAGILDDIEKMAAQIRGPANASGSRSLFGDGEEKGTRTPTWEDLTAEATSTSIGLTSEEKKRQWSEGGGPPHTDAKLRLFGTQGEPRVTLYRDTAAWCPYCQKVWMMLEEKKIPYRVEKINMRSYGEKPAWYLAQVPSGLLPAISLDGKLMTESLTIMQTLEAAFPEHRRMLPNRDSAPFEEAVRLLNLERELFRWWCQFVFQPGESARKTFEETLDKVNNALGSSPGPWFLETSREQAGQASPDDGFSLVDLTYVPHLERMAASTAYWKGLQIRGNPRWEFINRWFEALEMRETYMATKSDFYTHVKDIPPQYGNGYSVRGAAGMAATIDGQDGSWKLPLLPLSPSNGLEPVLAVNDPGDEGARHEAAYKLAANHDAVARFACRGAGRGSGWSMLPGRAPLSDPNAQPALDIIDDVDVCLRRVASAMLRGTTDTDQAELQASSISAGGDPATIAAVALSLEYLRDRVGVPRDMSYPAARQFRAHLNWAVDTLRL